MIRGSLLPYEEETFYLSGPMTGLPEYNYPKFERTTKILRSDGYKVLSPHENPPYTGGGDEHQKWLYYMDLCKTQVEQSTAILLMVGWPNSDGAVKELQWSINLGHGVFYYYEGSPYTLVPMDGKQR